MTKDTDGFGMAHIKAEGKPAHPEDVYYHCGCKKCEEVWQRQMEAYNKYVESLNYDES